MINIGLKKYLQTPPADKRAVLKKQYLANMPSGASGRNCALHHLDYLAIYTRRLNLIEGKGSSQPMPKPSALRATDLFLCVEVCAEVIREDSLLQSDTEFGRSWTAFEELLERVKSKDGPEDFFEAAYLLLHLAALIFKRHVTDGAVEKAPLILSLEAYKAVAARFARPLFEPVTSSEEQLESLADNLRILARVGN